MICDTLENFPSYALLSPEVWKKIADFLKHANPDTAASQELLPGVLRVSIQRYETRPFQAERMEYHKAFADIQLLLAGEETLYYAPFAGLTMVQDFNAAQDCGFVRAPADALPLKLRPGNFVLLLPQEPHMPCIGTGNSVVKAVIKIAASAFC